MELNHPPTLTEDLVYMAGYFDGEGCVSFANAKNIVASINSADEESIRLFYKNFGGHFSFMGAKNAKNSKRAIWRWAVSGNGAQQFLTAVLPWLRAKKTVAQLGLVPTFGKRGQPVPEEERLLRLKIQDHIHAINQRVTVCQTPTLP